MNADTNLIRVKNYISKIPALPVTVTKILEICNNPNTSPVDLNRVISVDPVLMGRVLKLINSAYYGLSNQVTSLSRAIIMLGINTVKNLALSTAVMGSLGPTGGALNMQGFWRHSLCVGVTSKLIAKARRIPTKELEEYFIAGLLHDMGKIPLNNTLTEMYIEAMGQSDREQIPLYLAEKQILGYDHCEIGVLIGELWKLGGGILDTIQYHHQLDNYSGKYIEILQTVVVANYYANVNEIGFSGNRFPETVPDEVLNALGIRWELFEEISEDVVREIEKAQIFLKIAEEG
ncbi:MAG TPA: HDOD domain-containing protein [Spirochaetales bacterium]|nr:HDOD domain-containing protein [Spirochaetales bacterium]HOV37627.1 HDOD domain-containing protein [Spirochaetales bacterium]